MLFTPKLKLFCSKEQIQGLWRQLLAVEGSWLDWQLLFDAWQLHRIILRNRLLKYVVTLQLRVHNNLVLAILLRPLQNIGKPT